MASRIIEQSEVKVHPYGDYIYGDCGKYLMNIPKEFIDNGHPIPLPYFGAYNPFQALMRAIDTDPMDYAKMCSSFKYNCLILSNLGLWVPFGLVPVAVVTLGDCSEYKNRIPDYYRDMALDKEWMRNHNPVDRKPDDHITRAMMGSSYTEGTLPTDGSASTEMSALSLDNGDIVTCINWVWHNK